MEEPLLAVFSDVHSNLEALQAVIADMDELGIRQRVCLGDTVGYAANPAKCLEVVRSLDCPVLKGNHDEYVSEDGEVEGINEGAALGVEFSRAKLSNKQRAYLASLPFSLIRDGLEFVHASLDDPAEWNYVFLPADAERHFRHQTERICFCGHTHRPRIWHCSDQGRITTALVHHQVGVPAHGKVLINVGSVGQPRDGIPQACYVIYNAEAKRAEFRRVPYDIPKTRRKILRAKLPRETADRLGKNEG